jgi:peptidoglycan hydrolase-like protein with peptidoglycan-binding domain
VNNAGLALGGGFALLLLLGKKGSGAEHGATGSWEEEPKLPTPAPAPGNAPTGGSGGHVPAPAGNWWQSPALPTTGWAPTTGVPDEVIARMAKAVATGNPDELERVATELNREGYNQQAEDLLHAAELLRTAQAAGKTPAPAPANTIPWSTPTTPENTLPIQRPIPPNPLIRSGSKGAPVSLWQNALRAVGFGASRNLAANELFASIAGADSEVLPDGQFGPATDRATRIVQTDYGIKVDGIVGDKTRAALGSEPVLGKRILKLGTRGPAVRSWQGQLVSDGAGAIVPDGMFGAITKTATIAWQKMRGLPADGIVGPATLRAIGTKPANPIPVALPPSVIDPDKWRTMRRGTAGKDVAEWQMILTRDGFGPIPPDGKFGPLTEEASRQWQTAHGLTSDGIVGPATRAAIADNAPPAGGVGGQIATRVQGDAQPMQMFRAPHDFKAYSPLPGLIPEAVPDEVVPADRSLAAKFAQHLFNVKPGDEDRDLVSMFQRAHGLNDTGSYGPGTALALVPYGIVPAKPFYWPRKGLLRAKASYRVTLLEQSNRDPQRADEWAAAANV